MRREITSFFLGALLLRLGLSLGTACLLGLFAAWFLSSTEDPRKELGEREVTRREWEAEHGKRDEAIRKKAAMKIDLSPREALLVRELDSRMWLDAVVGVIYRKYEPKLSRGLARWVTRRVESLLSENGGLIRRLTFSQFHLGDVAPRISRVTATRLGSPDEIELQLDIEHEGALVDVHGHARLGGRFVGVVVPLRLHCVSIVATLRVRARMSERPPYVEVLEIGFTKKPQTLDFALGVIGLGLKDVTGLPNVALLVRGALERVVANYLVAPNHIEIPLERWLFPASLAPTVAAGSLLVRVMRAVDVPDRALGGPADPYVLLEMVKRVGAEDACAMAQAAAVTSDGQPTMSGDNKQLLNATLDTTKNSKNVMYHGDDVWQNVRESNQTDENGKRRYMRRTSVRKRTQDPVWLERFALPCEDPDEETLRVTLMDYDALLADDLLGSAELPAQVFQDLLQDAHANGLGSTTPRLVWLRLKPPGGATSFAAAAVGTAVQVAASGAGCLGRCLQLQAEVSALNPRVLLRLEFVQAEPARERFCPLEQGAADYDATPDEEEPTPPPTPPLNNHVEQDDDEICKKKHEKKKPSWTSPIHSSNSAFSFFSGGVSPPEKQDHPRMECDEATKRRGSLIPSSTAGFPPTEAPDDDEKEEEEEEEEEDPIYFRSRALSEMDSVRTPRKKGCICRKRSWERRAAALGRAMIFPRRIMRGHVHGRNAPALTTILESSQRGSLKRTLLIARDERLVKKAREEPHAPEPQPSLEREESLLSEEAEIELQEESSSLRNLDQRTLREVYTRGAATLREGYASVKNLRGLRTYRKRWVRLQVSLEYGGRAASSTTEDRHLTISLSSYKESDIQALEDSTHASLTKGGRLTEVLDFLPPVRSSQLAIGRDGAHTHRKAPKERKQKKKKKRKKSLLMTFSSHHRQVRLSKSGDLVVRSASSRRWWRLRCGDESSEWYESIKLALSLLRNANPERVHDAAQSANEHFLLQESRGNNSLSSCDASLSEDDPFWNDDEEKRSETSSVGENDTRSPFEVISQSGAYGVLVCVEVIEARGLVPTSTTAVRPRVVLRLGSQRFETSELTTTQQWFESTELLAGAGGPRDDFHAAECGGLRVVDATLRVSLLESNAVGCLQEIRVSRLVDDALRRRADTGDIAPAKWYPLQHTPGDLRLRITPRLFAL